MDHTTNPELYMFAKRERIYLSRLRQLPPALYESLVRRLVKGDSVRVTAKFLHSVKPEIAEESARKWLAVLAKEIGRTKMSADLDEQTRKEIGEFNEALVAANRLPLRPRPEPPTPESPSPGSMKRFEAHVSQALLDETAEEKLNYAWAVQMKRVDRMVDMEERTGLIFPLGYKNVDSLRMIAEALLKKEALRGFPIRVRPTEKNLSPLAQRVAELDDVDRNLFREGAAKIMQMIEEEARGEYSEADNPSGGRIAPESGRGDAGGAEGSEQNRNSETVQND